jgi:hypothetical protein
MSPTLESPSIQIVFLNQIRDKLPAGAVLADELSEILSISRDSAYRRIRGETVLSLDEVKKIQDGFGVSIDSIISPNSNMVLLEHQLVDFNFSLKEWLQSLIYKLEYARSSRELKLIFAAKDIPLFHYFLFPELASFKLFVWLKSVILDTKYESMVYAPSVIPKEILAEASRAGNLYSSLPTTEIWSDEIITGTLKQIEFYAECQFFENKNLPALLHDQLVEFIHQLRRDADRGMKKEGGSFELYHNEILIPDNTIYGVIHNKRVVFINYNTMDLLTTRQDSFCEKTEVYMTNLIRNSALISSTAEKERNRFFNKIEKKIMDANSKLK